MYQVIGNVQAVSVEENFTAMKVLVKTFSFDKPDVDLMNVYTHDNWPDMKAFIGKDIVFSFSHYYSSKNNKIMYAGTKEMKPRAFNPSEVKAA